MYVIRSHTRASLARPRARFIRSRRYPLSPPSRHLHNTRPLAKASRPPEPPARPDGLNRRGEGQNVAEEPSDVSIASQDPEVLARQLQRSRDASRRYSAALSRQQRGKKAQGLPPVHIPAWFVKRRVVSRQQDALEQAHDKSQTALTIDLKQSESGQRATFSMQTGKDVDPAHVLLELLRGLWSRSLDDGERRTVEKYFQDRAHLSAKQDLGHGSSTDADAETVTEQKSSPELEIGIDGTGSPAIKEALVGLDSLIQEIQIMHARQEESNGSRNTQVQETFHQRSSNKPQSLNSPKRLSSLILAEITAVVAASLASSSSTAGDSFASAKTNLILHGPGVEHEQSVDECVHAIARQLQSDLIVLHPQDLAQLAGDYLGEGPDLSPQSVRSLGYETYRLSSEPSNVVEEAEEPAEDEQESNQSRSAGPFEPDRSFPFAIPIIGISPSLIKQLKENQLKRVVARNDQFDGASNTMTEDSGRSRGAMQLEDMKLMTLLDALINSTETKQSHHITPVLDSGFRTTPDAFRKKATIPPTFFYYSRSGDSTELELNSILPTTARRKVTLAASVGSLLEKPKIARRPKIVYVKDFKELNATHYGGRIVQKLEDLVRKRRDSGESIMIIGSTCSRELTPETSTEGVQGLQSDGESSLFRTIVVTDDLATDTDAASSAAAISELALSSPSPVEKNKFRHINLVHIQAMLRSLDPAAAAQISDVEEGPQQFQSWASIFPDSFATSVLTYDEIHRIALTTMGIHITNLVDHADQISGTPAKLNWGQVALAIGLLKASDAVKYSYFEKLKEMNKKPRRGLWLPQIMPGGRIHVENLTNKATDDKINGKRQIDMTRILLHATKHEKHLASGIADPQQIKTTFDQVHVPKDTIDSIRTITSLSLLRPQAFSYGILASEKISGALLYGPPGTGKTLLAKAVAKESGSTVLEVSGSQIMDKYVGEGEKNVAAIFSLARKLSPCIVFLDEADAIFASRDVMRDRTSHRDILNQFLKEWDGLNDLSVFVMVATNRPFDLDDAVIRRLPRRILVDLPTEADRKEILRIHLRGEQLHSSVDLDDMAKRTPFYSGSDLKNIAVSAALACVKEENEQAALAAMKSPLDPPPPPTPVDNTSLPSSPPAPILPGQLSITPQLPTLPHPDSAPAPPLSPHRLLPGQPYPFPDKRTLHARHFDIALQDISASISEDMSSLNAIKKFDEQYGDRKGRKRKKDFGFGSLERSESAARVRV